MFSDTNVYLMSNQCSYINIRFVIRRKGILENQAHPYHGISDSLSESAAELLVLRMSIKLGGYERAIVTTGVREYHQSWSIHGLYM